MVKGIFHTRTLLVNTNVSLPDSELRVIPVVEVYELLTVICDILDNAVSKQVENTANILAFLFHSASR